LEYVAKELNLKTLNDWHLVRTSEFQNLGGGILLQNYGGLFPLLKTIYPDFSLNKIQPQILKKQDSELLSVSSIPNIQIHNHITP